MEQDQKQGKAQNPRRGASRDVILETASEEFARHGFAGARIEAIAHKTRLNVRMIYYHFRSKEGLYQAVLLAIYRHMATILDESEKTVKTDQDVVVDAFGRYVDLLGQNPRFADILVREAVDGCKRLGQLFADHPELYERVHQRAHQMFARNIDAGLLRGVDPALIVHSLTGMVCLLIAARSAQAVFLGGRTVTAGEWKSVLLDLFLHGLARHG